MGALVRTGFVNSADAPPFIDGFFSPKTEAAVLRFQSTYPRETGGPDGIVGVKTWGASSPPRRAESRFPIVIFDPVSCGHPVGRPTCGRVFGKESEDGGEIR
ncbi:peptidoglycan-binding protein [Streptomyces sp. NPDC001502]|uniref:peptidoglycan-binding domain-containing protein n=1 Tax=Streptomyces sp. NPDC001502 TaxID=3364578 RepID=UPI00367E9C31